MNKKNSIKNTTGMQAANVLSGNRQQRGDRFLSCKFEIIDDENTYSVSFNAKLTEEEAGKMLEAIQNNLYDKTADCLQTYLEQNNIAYSGFVSRKMPLGHNKTMKMAELFLQSDDCRNFDSYFGTADICYLIADYQKWITENCCQGCYLAVKRTFSEYRNLNLYHIIGQTFNYNETVYNESGYFAIRKNRNDVFLNNVIAPASEPVLPSFGCVDMMGILLNIDNIKTSEQVVKIAIK